MSTPLTQSQPASPPQRLLASDLGQAVNRRSRVRVAPVGVPPLLPWLRRPQPHRLLPLPLRAPPPHCASVVALQLALWERAPAVSTLVGVEPPAHREVQEDPSPLPRRLARALLASCRTMARCARERVARGFR